MNGHGSRRLLWLAALVLLIPGCYISSIVEPGQHVAEKDFVETAQHRVQRYTYDFRLYARAEHAAEQALLDSFTAHKISNVRKSDKLEPNSINIIVYLLQTYPAQEIHFYDVPWAFVSFGTLTLIPLYSKAAHPIEIHLVNPSEEYNNQIRVVRTQYVAGMWIWLPVAFMHRETDDAVAYQGWRRVFDHLIDEHLLN